MDQDQRLDTEQGVTAPTAAEPGRRHSKTLQSPTAQLILAIVSLLVGVVSGVLGLLIAVVLFVLLTYDFNLPQKLMPLLREDQPSNARAARLFLVMVLTSYSGGLVVVEALREGIHGSLNILFIEVLLGLALLVVGVESMSRLEAFLLSLDPPAGWSEKKSFGGMFALAVFLGVGGDNTLAVVLIGLTTWRILHERKRAVHYSPGNIVRRLADSMNAEEESFWTQVISLRETPRRRLAWLVFGNSTLALMLAAAFIDLSQRGEVLFALLVLQALGVGYFAIRYADLPILWLSVTSAMIWIAALFLYPESIPVFARLGEFLAGGAVGPETTGNLIVIPSQMLGLAFSAMLLGNLAGVLHGKDVQDLEERDPLQSVTVQSSSEMMAWLIALGAVFVGLQMLVSAVPSTLLSPGQVLGTSILLWMLAPSFVLLGTRSLLSQAAEVRGLPSKVGTLSTSSKSSASSGHALRLPPKLMRIRFVRVVISILLIGTATLAVGTTRHPVPLQVSGSLPIPAVGFNSSLHVTSTTFTVLSLELKARLKSEDAMRVLILDETAKIILAESKVVNRTYPTANLSIGFQSPQTVRVGFNVTDLDGDGSVQVYLDVRLQEGARLLPSPSLNALLSLLVLAPPSEIWMANRSLRGRARDEDAR